ncbi:hypothetical protein AVEN_252917-1 [Araneus ventricosus]|uniref:Uncharacterized protein n=1 Tax=Araneus ventricosus TaxID=182803 RepID=A0A4Y2FGP3_ARAVE|nr:hypothetical protein AVEN_252917-1 [Araneus ventricosus]
MRELFTATKRETTYALASPPATSILPVPTTGNNANRGQISWKDRALFGEAYISYVFVIIYMYSDSAFSLNKVVRPAASVRILGGHLVDLVVKSTLCLYKPVEHCFDGVWRIKRRVARRGL